jgi:hypothetical protein
VKQFPPNHRNSQLIKENPMRAVRFSVVLVFAAPCFLLLGGAVKTDSELRSKTDGISNGRNSLLTRRQWNTLEESIDRALKFLSKQQHRDGSFEAPASGQPGITSLVVMAFLARGHLPGEGPYGEQMNRAIDFVMDSRQPDGLFCYSKPGPHYVPNRASHTGSYNHAIAGLMLTEVYGMVDSQRNERIRSLIPQAIKLSRKQQYKSKRRPGDTGGWRYVRPHPNAISDLSVTAWQLMFLRSALNSGFDVPREYVDDAIKYVEKCYDPRRQLFRYRNYGSYRAPTRAMSGAGIVSLSLGGRHQTEMAQQAGKWVLSQSFDDYNRCPNANDAYHYSAFYCSQAMFQLGGDYWSQFYPRLMKTLLANQRANGSWDPEGSSHSYYGNTYTTALVVLTLTPPYQLLPIYQR